MRKHVLVLATTAAILALGANAAIAQAPGAETPGTQQSPVAQPNPADHGMMGDHPEMMGHGMMGHGMMGGLRTSRLVSWSRHHGSRDDANDFQFDGR